MTGELRYDHPPRPGEKRADVDPVRGAAAEPVDEHDRLGVGRAADEIPKPAGLRFGEALLEARDCLCVRHVDKLLFDRMDDLGGQDL